MSNQTDLGAHNSELNSSCPKPPTSPAIKTASDLSATSLSESPGVPLQVDEYPVLSQSPAKVRHDLDQAHFGLSAGDSTDKMGRPAPEESFENKIKLHSLRKGTSLTLRLSESSERKQMLDTTTVFNVRDALIGELALQSTLDLLLLDEALSALSNSNYFDHLAGSLGNKPGQAFQFNSEEAKLFEKISGMAVRYRHEFRANIRMLLDLKMPALSVHITNADKVLNVTQLVHGEGGKNAK